eukprot:364410-Chlamydomonas_euryale.AAC.17
MKRERVGLGGKSWDTSAAKRGVRQPKTWLVQRDRPNSGWCKETDQTVVGAKGQTEQWLVQRDRPNSGWCKGHETSKHREEQGKTGSRTSPACGPLTPTLHLHAELRLVRCPAKLHHQFIHATKEAPPLRAPSSMKGQRRAKDVMLDACCTQRFVGNFKLWLLAANVAGTMHGRPKPVIEEQFTYDAGGGLARVPITAPTLPRAKGVPEGLCGFASLPGSWRQPPVHPSEVQARS